MDNPLSVLHNYLYQYKSTLKKTSLDDIGNKHLCNNMTHIVYDMDHVKDQNCPKPAISSSDALMIKNTIIYLIEFKNSSIKRVKAKVIKNKLKGSRIIMKKLFSYLQLKKCSYRFVYCVVYNDIKSKSYHRGIRKAKLRFDLKDYPDNFFDEIYTNDISFFKKEFNKQYGCDK